MFIIGRTFGNQEGDVEEKCDLIFKKDDKLSLDMVIRKHVVT